MLITILAIVIALVAWSLHLMQQAIDRREFSLMLAGTLVAFSAAAMVGVYFLMGNYLGYITGASHYSYSEPFIQAMDIEIIDAVQVNGDNAQADSIDSVQPRIAGNSVELFPFQTYKQGHS
ncbi:hypothetical protein K9N68_18350 [Kovacikia minuta CCNUW1]|uniref:hypothetical protein n=1 Tax=Kovacikia minuta TaxID=2931930 RepID=UPI001CC91650|nr:hypothetical protein K9N68_18350 [Kovacikia minuta CCNUW1]